MKQNLIFLLKGLLFSTILMALSVLFLAFLMQKTQWEEAVMYPLLIIFFCISSLVGARYFAKHAGSRRFLWGIGFGTAFFCVYLIFAFLLNTGTSAESDHALTFLAFSLISGCAGGMLS